MNTSSEHVSISLAQWDDFRGQFDRTMSLLRQVRVTRGMPWMLACKHPSHINIRMCVKINVYVSSGFSEKPACLTHLWLLCLVRSVVDQKHLVTRPQRLFCMFGASTTSCVHMSAFVYAKDIPSSTDFGIRLMEFSWNTVVFRSFHDTNVREHPGNSQNLTKKSYLFVKIIEV